MNSGQACRPCRGPCSPIPGRDCSGDLPIVVSPPSPIVEALFLVYHLDVSQAFVQAPLKEDIFRSLPSGCDPLSGKVVRLLKCQFGLKQSSGKWNMCLVNWLVEEIGLKHRPFLYAFHAHLRFPVDLVWFRLSCDHGWIRSGSVNVRKQQQQQQQ